MKKDLPYFKWYPADALSDIDYASMDVSEVGLFHMCLNYAWVNDGLPPDPIAIAKLLHIDRRHFLRLWARVSGKFPEISGRLRNERQEQERDIAKNKSASATESVKARYERTTSTDGVVAPRALGRADCVSVSDSDSLPGRKGNLDRARETKFLPPASFTEFIRPWVERQKCADPAMAAQMWVGAISSPEDEAAAYASRDRYFCGDSVSRGFVMEPKRFISEQAACGWTGTWAAPQKKPMTPYDSLLAKYAEEAKNGSKHD